MHWMMWIFWGFFAVLFLGSYLVDVLTGRKYSLNKKEKTLNQKLAEADARREAGRNNNQSGMF
ncbi:hypothetical protein [Planococcus sp. ISL-109]|uniref:hypothetical protein n=1 Tax=Planococcus sp. ISL-109 TaxID=2819166 RepID=UPI001BE9FA02|nr:hypothetical protein [Planococcus sp. ISL-109]MBT2583454.1 hypothetical protein [Planococcus sp. ISL-109]